MSFALRSPPEPLWMTVTVLCHRTSLYPELVQQEHIILASVVTPPILTLPRPLVS